MPLQPLQDLTPPNGGGVCGFELDVKNELLFVSHLLIIWGEEFTS